MVRECQEQLPYDTRAFEMLVRRFEAGVHAFCLGIVHSDADAEEVTQDAFLRIFHHIRTFEGRSAFRTWLFSIARNLALTRLSEIKLRAARAGEDYLQNPPEPVVGTPVEEEGPALAALRSLDPADRDILALRHIAGLRLSEAAEVLDIGPSAAKMRYSRALSRLREKYRDIDPPEP